MELSDAGRASHAAPAREAAVLGVALAEAAEAEAEEEAAAKETEVAARRRRPQREAAAADSQVQDLSARLAAARAEVADGRETPRGGGRRRRLGRREAVEAVEAAAPAADARPDAERRGGWETERAAVEEAGDWDVERRGPPHLSRSTPAAVNRWGGSASRRPETVAASAAAGRRRWARLRGALKSRLILGRSGGRPRQPTGEEALAEIDD